MVTPYDWQEAVGNRAQYIEGKLSQGSPVLAVSLEVGVLLYTYRRQARKIYEIYDRLAFAGVGLQSDVEAIRASALEFASREGYNRSEQDVTIQRVANAMSIAVKRAFGDFSAAPFVARSLFAEIQATPSEDIYYSLDYDGDYGLSRSVAILAGSDIDSTEALAKLKAMDVSLSGQDAVAQVDVIWQELRGDLDLPSDAKPEAVLVRRSDDRENRFESLFPEDF